MLCYGKEGEEEKEKQVFVERGEETKGKRKERCKDDEINNS